MILYHFTTHHYLPAILREGLSKGEVPLSDAEWLNGVNLTTSALPVGLGVSNGWEVVTEEVAAEYRSRGVQIGVGSVFPDKSEVRIKVRIPSSDRKLQQWLPWARKHVDGAYIERLTRSFTATPRGAKTWWIYWGTIPPSAFVSVDALKPPYTPPELAAAS